ncbi:citrate synthase/methylcitrate synthase [Fictibacillus sp. Mic-4]|uniref:citrate synthase/methylcitrate synthase n=1 Tax=Fictibacillus TaxID=1329200 RepID=UPI0004125CB6|nr:citrate synthase/methylcitrate synthase [Fictibacillus gelatini]
MVVAGLEGIVAAETNISLVDGEKGHLVYRGYWAKDLALHYSFEEVAFLLWNDRLPEKEELQFLKAKFQRTRTLSLDTISLIKNLPSSMDMMAVLRTVLSSLGDDKFGWPSDIDQAVALTSIVPSIIAIRYRNQNGQSIVMPDQNLNHVENFLYMLTGKIPSKAHVKALTAYLVLTMEHGMNASTFTARVIASTQSDMVSAITGAIGAMKGPLHGGAPSEVMDMLDEVGSKEHAEKWIRSVLERGEKLMGFGHRVYKTRDPRAEALQEITGNLVKEDEWFDLANYVEKKAIELLNEYKPGRRIYTNVEFFAAAILRAVQIPREIFTSVFTASRMVGWTAHVLEQNMNNRIFRPQSEYIGRMPE